jgi:EAL domain-containing protein (putative c-di-GMP-specific phosphodiesterase class I)
VEALARWEHPERGLLAPDAFIPLAEETGLIIPLGLQLLDAAVAQGAAWLQAGHRTTVAVNLSAVQLADPAFPDETLRALQRYGAPAGLLMVEITETKFMERLDVAQVALERLAEVGVRVVIDDFGTGYSSLSRLRELPVVGVKVDRAFTHGLGEDPSVEPVLAAITALAHSLALQVVAEGIETGPAHAAAVAVGCDFLQGYWLARPGPPDDIEALLQLDPPG